MGVFVEGGVWMGVFFGVDVNGCFCWGGCGWVFLLEWVWMGVFVGVGLDGYFCWGGCG